MIGRGRMENKESRTGTVTVTGLFGITNDRHLLFLLYLSFLLWLRLQLQSVTVFGFCVFRVPIGHQGHHVAVVGTLFSSGASLYGKNRYSQTGEMLVDM